MKPELNILSIEEEIDLLDKLSNEQGIKTNSRVLIRYGNSVYGNDKLDPIPEYLLDLCNKLINRKVLDALPEDVSINTYYRGDSIPAHIDKIDSEDIEESVEVEIKRKFAEIAELALTNYSTTDKSPVKSLLFDHAIGEILNAQMSVVKVITFKS